MEQLEELPYQLRWADSEKGERCVSVDDMIEWLLSIIDCYNEENNSDVTEIDCRIIRTIIDQLERIKNFKTY